MRIALLSSILGVLAFGCASHDGATGEKQREPDAKVDPLPQISLKAAIASVSLIRDCPDPPPASAKEASASAKQAPAAEAVPPSPGAMAPADQSVARGARSQPMGDSPNGWSPPCQQSTMQLTLSHDAKQAQRFEIKAARLTAAGTGAQLATIPVRGPTRWDEAGRYVDWDESLPAASELKVSYRLGEPDWSLVSKALGSDDTYGSRYVLEVDVELAGRTLTIRSPEFQREYEHVVVT